MNQRVQISAELDAWLVRRGIVSARPCRPDEDRASDDEEPGVQLAPRGQHPGWAPGRGPRPKDP